MTAVPAQRSKTKDPFQLELDREIAKRKSRGLSTGYSDDESSDKDEAYSDDYEEDFNSETDGDSDDDLLQQYLRSSPPMKSSANNSSEARSSKLDEKIGYNVKEESSLSQTRKSTSFLTKQNAIDEKQEFENSLDDDPLLAFLKDDKQKTPPWKVQKTNESNSFQIGLFGRESTSKKKVTFEPNTIDLSPQEESSFRTTQSQPQSDSPKQPQHSPKSVTDTVTLDTLSALSGKREVKDLTPKPAPRRSSEEDLLKPLPKSRRRHDSNRSSISEESVARSLTKSPELQQLPEEATTKTEKIPKSLDYVVSKFPSLHGPRHESVVKRGEKIENKNDISAEVEKKEETATPETALFDRTEPGKKLIQSDSDRTSSTEDLLAQLQAATESHTPSQKTLEPTATPEVKITDKTQSSQTTETVGIEAKDSSTESHELSDGDLVHQTTFIIKDDVSVKSGSESLRRRPLSRNSTSRKSPRTPLVDYRGLGSLHGLQQLRTYNADDKRGLKSATNVRSTVYLQWLADREKKLKVKKKLKVEEEEKENERKQKEMEDRVQEGASARKAWLEKKEEILKEQALKKRKEEKRLQQEKAKKAEEKRKSAQKADVVRERALTEAKKRHREEVRKKKQEEKERQQNEKEKKKKNAEELDKWMEKRSKQWESDRRKEVKEKKAKEKQVKQVKEEKAKKAEDDYNKWREKKEEQDMERRKVNRHDEDRPPWSPANKVIPRVR